MPPLSGVGLDVSGLSALVLIGACKFVGVTEHDPPLSFF
jgi:hypothetical protein